MLIWTVNYRKNKRIWLVNSPKVKKWKRNGNYYGPNQSKPKSVGVCYFPFSFPKKENLGLRRKIRDEQGRIFSSRKFPNQLNMYTCNNSPGLVLSWYLLSSSYKYVFSGFLERQVLSHPADNKPFACYSTFKFPKCLDAAPVVSSLSLFSKFHI